MKYRNDVCVYALNNHLLKTFYYGLDLAIYLTVFKVTE